MRRFACFHYNLSPFPTLHSRLKPAVSYMEGGTQHSERCVFASANEHVGLLQKHNIQACLLSWVEFVRIRSFTREVHIQPGDKECTYVIISRDSLQQPDVVGFIVVALNCVSAGSQEIDRRRLLPVAYSRIHEIISSTMSYKEA